MGHRLEATVAIPTLNPDPEVFRQVLRSALQPERPIVVVDMSTDARVADICLANGPLVTYDHFSSSTGVSQSRNRCVELSSSRHVVFLDSDAYPCGDWAEPMLRRLLEPDVGVVGARILGVWRGKAPRMFHTFTAGLLLSLLDLGPTAVDLPRVIGTSYAIDRERVPTPPFDESIGRKPGRQVAGEENKLCLETRRMGFRVVYEPDALVFHDLGPERLRWRWMWRRAYNSGRERTIEGPVPPLYAGGGPDDRAFKAAIALPFLAGRLRGAPRAFGRSHGRLLSDSG